MTCIMHLNTFLKKKHLIYQTINLLHTKSIIKCLTTQIQPKFVVRGVQTKTIFCFPDNHCYFVFLSEPGLDANALNYADNVP